MNPQGESRWVFERASSGLLVPTGLVAAGVLLPFSAGPDERDRRVVRSLGIVPTFEDLWDGDRPDINELLRSVPLQLWMRLLACLATLLAREDADPANRYQLIEPVFRRPQAARLRRILESTPFAFPMAEFPVLLLMELAFSRAEVAATPPERIDPDSLERMAQGIYAVWSHLTDKTDSRIRADPAGVAAALNEMTLLGSPMRRILTAFGLWAWDHNELDDQARAARTGFDEYLNTSLGVSLHDWVVGVALATFITQNQPLEEVVTQPVFISAGRSDLTLEGQALLARCLGHLSTTANGLRAACRELDGDGNLLESPSLLALKRTPCIKALGSTASYRAISPVHLAEAALERPLIERTKPESTRPRARTDFGAVVEAYVHGLLRGLFGDRYQRLAPVTDRKRAEGVIWFPSGFLVVECKARRASELLRYSTREDANYLEELVQSGLRTAVAQIEATTEDILDGTIANRSSLIPATVGSLVVFLQDLALSPVSRSVLDCILPRTRTEDGVVHLRPQIISLERLEELDRWLHLDLLGELRKKMCDKEMTLECLNNFLLHEGRKPGGSAVREAAWRTLLEFLRPYLSEHSKVGP